MRAAVYSRQSRGKAKSIDEQLKLGHQVLKDEGWRHTGDYQDGTSASRFATKPRGGWAEVVLAVQRKAFDVLVLWESSRGDRTPESWFAFLSSCRDVGVRIHVVSHERTYDLRVAREWKTLAEDGVNNAYESELLSVRVQRGHGGAAVAGRPSHGNAPYGYTRTYDPATGALVGQEPHPVYAPVVREIVERVAKGDPVSVITKDLNARGVPTGGANAWYRARVRLIVANPAYIGLRRYRGKTYPGSWPAIVDAEAFQVAQRVLGDPGRKTTRPGAQKHLLSYYMTAPCGGTVCVVSGRYRCAEDSCVSVAKDPADELVTELVLTHLAKPEVYDALKHAGEDRGAEVARLTNEAQTLQAQLDGWRASAVRGETTPASLAAIEAGLQQRIDEATRAAAAATVPPELVGWLGGASADVAARWAAAGVQARRAVLRGLGLRVALKASGRTGGVAVPVHERLDVDWV